MGFCALDRQRRPLHGDEIRACWEAGSTVPEAPAAGIPRSAPTFATHVGDGTSVRQREFVEVATGVRVPPVQVAVATAGVSDLEVDPEDGTPPPPPETRWSLWGDGDL